MRWLRFRFLNRKPGKNISAGAPPSDGTYFADRYFGNRYFATRYFG